MIKLFVLVDGTQVVAKSNEVPMGHNVREPCQIMMVPGQDGYRIMMNRYPIRANTNETLFFHRNSIITVATPDDELEELYTRTVSPIDLSSKMSQPRLVS